MNYIQEESQIFLTSVYLIASAFVYNNDKDNLGKFDARVDEAILLGYFSTSKAYRMFNKKNFNY